MSSPSLEPSEPRFIVLWIMSQSQSIRQAVAQYFKNPGVLPGSVGLMETSDMGGKMPTQGHSQDLQTPSPMVNEIRQECNSLEEVKKRIEEMIAQMPELENLKNQVLMEITADGLRIELLERENSHFFDVGSANVKPETQKILGLIAPELGRLPDKVTIEGHTDSRPYGNQSYTNWELSADRANAARRLMETSGLRPDQVFAVRGFADRQLRNRQDPLDFQNRRVSIIVNFQNPKDKELLKNLNLNGAKTSPPPDAGPSAKPPQELEPAEPAKPVHEPELGKPPVELPPPPGQEHNDTSKAVLVGENPLGDEINRQLKPMLPKIREGW